MKKKILLPFVAILIAIALLGCPIPPVPSTAMVVSIADISGVTAPAFDAVPVTMITETTQYTGTISWSGSPEIFLANTVYVATITITAKAGYTLIGVPANFFTVSGTTSISNTENSGVIAAIFPETSAAPEAVINIASITGVTPPVFGAVPVTTITETDQYTGVVTWSGDPETFAEETVYVATITLTAKAGYTLIDVLANFFTVAGATSVSNASNSGVVTALFPRTEEAPPEVVSILAIPGIAVPVTGAAPTKNIIDTAQYTGTVTWSPFVSDMFVSKEVYSASITLVPKAGYTLTGVAKNSFTVSGSTSTTNAVDSGVIKAIFPKTTANLAAINDYLNTGVGTMKAVQGGTFHNGSINMTVSSFRMSQHEVTRAQFQAVMGIDPVVAGLMTSYSSGTSDPVMYVNFYHALVFCNKLSKAEGLTPVYTKVNIGGLVRDLETLSYEDIPTQDKAAWDQVYADWSANGYRLPTEAEWQFAAQGGNSSNNYIYAGSNTIDAVAWYQDNSDIGNGRKTHPVGEKLANELDFKDMSGNVCEWCWDLYGAYPSTDQIDYRGNYYNGGINIRRILGGSWDSLSSANIITYQSSSFPGTQSNIYGFRVVRP